MNTLSNSDDEFPRSEHLPPHGELSWRFTVLSEELREARALKDNERVRQLRRELRGVWHQLRQSHTEWREGADAAKRDRA